MVENAVSVTIAGMLVGDNGKVAGAYLCMVMGCVASSWHAIMTELCENGIQAFRFPLTMPAAATRNVFGGRS